MPRTKRTLRSKETALKGSTVSTSKKAKDSIKNSQSRLKMGLAEELWYQIFGYLNYDDLMIVRQIDDDWREIVNRLLDTRLVLINDDRAEDDILIYKLFHSNLYVTIDHFLLGRSMINFRINNQAHEFIKKLIIFNPRNLNNLIGLDNLIHLEIISDLNFKRTISPFVLSFANLVTLNLIFSTDVKLIIDAPKLKYFKSNLSLSSLKLMRQENLEELYLPSNNHMQSYQFTNLKVLSCNHFAAIHDFFEPFKSLKEVHFYNLREFHGLHQYFMDLLDRQFRVYYKNFSIEVQPLQSREIRSIPMRRLEDNHFDIYDTFDEAYGDFLQEELNIKFLDLRSFDAIERLTNLKMLKVSGTFFNREKWIELLKVSRQLKSIDIDCSLNRTFLQLIPTHCPYLTTLKMNHYHDLDFIFNLKYLKTFQTTYFFKFNLFKRMLIELRFLRNVHINFFKLQFVKDKANCQIDNNSPGTLQESKDIFIQLVHSVDDWIKLLGLES